MAVSRTNSRQSVSTVPDAALYRVSVAPVSPAASMASVAPVVRRQADVDYSAGSVPKAETLPPDMSGVRSMAAAAVSMDSCGRYAEAAELYSEAGEKLLQQSQRMASGAQETRSAALQVADQYLMRAGVLRAHLDVLRKEKRDASLRHRNIAPSPAGDYWHPDMDEAEDVASEGGMSDGEIRTAKKRKLSFRSAARLVRRLISVPFPGMKRAFSSENFGTKVVQTHCNITKRKFLSKDELTPAAATALVPLYKMGSPHVLWACACLKRSVYHRKFAKTKVDRRTAVLSPQAFYMGAKEELVRCVPIHEITQVIISPDSWVAMIAPKQYDILFQPQEQALATISQFVEVVLELSEYYSKLYNGPKVQVRRITADIDPNRLELCAPAQYDVPAFVPLKVDIVESKEKPANTTTASAAPSRDTARDTARRDSLRDVTHSTSGGEKDLGVFKSQPTTPSSAGGSPASVGKKRSGTVFGLL